MVWDNDLRHFVRLHNVSVLSAFETKLVLAVTKALLLPPVHGAHVGLATTKMTAQHAISKT